MNGHRITWIDWLVNISPFSHPALSWRSELIGQMAEGLSLAAPQGPSGMPCSDPLCTQHEPGEIIKHPPTPREMVPLLEKMEKVSHLVKEIAKLL